MEDPQKDQGSQNSSQNKRFSSFKDSFVLYNNKFASIRFGFNYRSPYVSIAKVLDDQKGKRPVAGTQMYDNDHAIFFSFNIHELFALKKHIKDLVSGKMSPMMFIHSSRGDNNKKVFLIGKGIDSDYEDKFGIACMICPTERTGQVILDDPIESAVFFTTETEVSDGVTVSDIDIIQEWFELAISSKMNTASDRNNFNGGYNRDNNNGGGGFKPRFNYGRNGNNGGGNSSNAVRDERPVVNKFGKSNNSSQPKEDAEDMFDADEDVLG